MADEDPNSGQTTHICSLSLFTDTPCQFSPDSAELVYLKDCNRSVSGHLRFLNISYDEKYMTEGLLICVRVGIFCLIPYFTVCPYHRSSLGLNWKRKTSCVFPGHTGKCKGDRPISLRTSYALVSRRGIFLHIGSAICKACRSQISNDLETFPDMVDVFSNDSCCFEQPLEDGVDLTDEMSDLNQFPHDSSTCNDYITSDDKTKKCEDYEHMDLLETDSTCTRMSQFESENFSASCPSSQISSWSIENCEQSRSLSDINRAFDIIGNGKISPIKFQIRKDVEDLKPRTLRTLKRKAQATIHEALDCLAPLQGKKVLQLIENEVSSVPSPKADELILHLYKESTDRNVKKQLLSMICFDFSKQKLRDLVPGLSTYAIDQARTHAKSHGKGAVPPEKDKLIRQRIDKEKLEHALDFFLSPAFHQVTAFGTKDMCLQSGEVMTVPEVVRTACHSTLVNIYQSFCQETEYSPLSRATLFRILRACPASKRTNLKGLDNVAADGAVGFDTLLETLTSMETYITNSDKSTSLKECRENLLAAKLYMKTDYKAHLKQKDSCADHCINFALSDPKDQNYQQMCSDHTHNLKCDRCAILPDTFTEIKKHMEILQGAIPTDIYTDMYADLDCAFGKIVDWKRHILRTVNQDRGRSELLKGLLPEQAVIVMDWAMKFLPMAYREKQSDWFGQKGVNWHVSVCIHKSENNELKHRTFAHCLEATKQDWNAVSLLLEHTLLTIKSQLPQITEVFLRSDNAGCYHCSNLWLSIPFISQRTGISIRRYDFSEAQSGKSYCDAKIAHMRAKIRKTVIEGNDVLCAADMKSAIDRYGGVTGCQAAHIEINSFPTDSSTGLIKGISKISNVEFQDDGCMKVWRAYDIGKGKDMAIQGELKNQERTVNVIADFTPPTKVEGSIKQRNSEDSIGCPDGCSDTFPSFTAMHDHCLLGEHHYDLQQLSTYDKVKLKWYDICVNLSESLQCNSTLLDPNSELLAESNEIQGWALKKEKKHVRFSEKVKTYLRCIFAEGDKNGQRMNSLAVAKNMRVVQENGKKLFNHEDYLDSSQINSFFSRLAAEKKIPPKCTDDLDSTMFLVEKIEALDEVASLFTDL